MTILFYPELVGKYSKLAWLCSCFNIKYHNDKNKPYDLSFYCSYKTISEQDDFVKNNLKMLNKGCYDVSKTRVDKIFETDLIVNPETHYGFCVRKSENHTHDGQLIKCPYKKKTGYIYQKNIDTFNNGRYSDYRLFFAGGIKFITQKLKTERFLNGNVDFVLHKTEDVLSIQEIRFIEDKCRVFGVDFAEIDMLIDSDGKKYVIDINNLAGMLEGFLTDQKNEIFRIKNKSSFWDFISLAA